MKIITWNINSVRLRLDLVQRLLHQWRPDVLCLQETKVQSNEFPYTFFIGQGYDHIHVQGIKGYNGVAVIAREAFATKGHESWCQKHDARHVHATLLHSSRPIELHNLYVPAGGDVPDPMVNEKFAHKLQFLDELTEWWRKKTAATVENSPSQIIVGDLNIAPLPNDVWSHRQLLEVVSHTPIEVERLNGLQLAGGWVDALRHIVPESEKLYTWWSYRNHDWKKSNRGRRLDHIWISPDLVPHLKSATILKEARDWPKPSDHVPVMIELDQ